MITVYVEEDMDVCNKFHGNPSDSCRYISLEAKTCLKERKKERMCLLPQHDFLVQIGGSFVSRLKTLGVSVVSRFDSHHV